MKGFGTWVVLKGTGDYDWSLCQRGCDPGPVSYDTGCTGSVANCASLLGTVRVGPLRKKGSGYTLYLQATKSIIYHILGQLVPHCLPRYHKCIFSGSEVTVTNETDNPRCRLRPGCDGR